MLVRCEARSWREILTAVALCCCLTSESRAQMARHSSVEPCPTGPRPSELRDISLGGIVLDPTGRQGQPGVTIVIENEVTRQQWERKTGPAGLYQVRNLLPGCYQLTVHTPPFRPASQRIVVPADPSQGDPEMMHVFVDTTAPDSGTLYVSAETIVLQLGTQEELTITRDRTLMNATDGSLGTTLARRDIEALPLTSGRTLQSVFNLVPGIVVTDSTGTLAQFTSAGQRRFGNRLTIDGIEADLAVDIGGVGLGPAASGAMPAAATSGGTQTLVPLGAVDEIQVRTTNAPAGSARAPGANTAIITRAGGDRLTGSVFMDVRPHQLGESDWFANAVERPKREVHYADTGASVGGPAIPNRGFFFVSWERQLFDRRVDTTVPVPSQSVRETASMATRALLDAYPIPNGPELGQGLAAYSHRFPASSDLSTLSVRVDGHVSARHHLFARINTGASDGDALTKDGQLPYYSFADTEATTTKTATTGLTSVLSSSLVDDVRVNISVHHGSLIASRGPYGNTQPLSLLGLAAPGASGSDTLVLINLFPDPSGAFLSGRAAANAQRQFQIVDTLSMMKGRHEWRFGGDYRRVIASTNRAANQYLYTFASPLAYVEGSLKQLTLDHVLPAQVRIESWSAFAQDSFRILPRLTLDYGLRYRVAPAPFSVTQTQPLLIQFETLPRIEPLSRGSRLWNTASTDLEPHVAAAWQMRASPGRETTLRTGWNLTFDELANPGASAFGRGFPYVSERVISAPVFPLSPNDLTAIFPPQLELDDGDNGGEYYSFPRNFRSPRTYSWYLGVEQALGSVQRLGLVYVGSSGRDLVYAHTYYAGTPIVHAYSNDATSSSHALLAEYVRRLSHCVEARVAYTWSHAIDTDSGEVLDPQAPPAIIEPRQNRGSADFDRRHVLAGVVSFHVPSTHAGTPLRALFADWQVDVGWSVRSGGPFSVTLSRHLGLGFYTVRPDPVPGVNVWIDSPNDPAKQQLNPRAFIAPTASPQGKLGRNTFLASPLRQLDLSLSRAMPLRGRAILRLRVDAFNVLNVTNVGAPKHVLYEPQFGQTYQTYADALGTGTLRYGGLTPLQQLGGPRSIQLGLRFEF